MRQATEKALEFDDQYPDGEIKVTISRPRPRPSSDVPATRASLPAMWHIRVKAIRDRL